MYKIHASTASSNDNNAMLVRFSRQNLAEWKAEKALCENYGKKPTRKDKIVMRNNNIRIAQEKKKKEKEKEKENEKGRGCGMYNKPIEDCQVDWVDVF